MPHRTENYGFEAPLGTEPIRDGDDTIRDMADAIDAELARIEALFPAGIMMPYAGASAPTGWLLCQGQAVSRSTYATLFAVVGEQYGNGDGSTTFNLPDLRGRTPVGAGTGSGLTARTRGDKLGAETHDHTGNIPNHTHSISSDGSHTHVVPESRTEGSGPVATGSGATYMADLHHTHITQSAGSHSHGGATGWASTTAFTTASESSLQPSTVVNFIIKAA